MIDRRARQLARTFQLVLLAVGAPAAAIHCGSSSPASPGGDGGASDATTGNADGPSNDSSVAIDSTTPGDDGASTSDASDLDADAGAIVSCVGAVTIRDGAPDGEEFCDYAVPCTLDNYGLGTTGCQVLPTYGDGSVVDANESFFPYCYLLEGHGCVDGSAVDPGEAGVEFECIGCPGSGRKPAGWSRARVRARDVRGAYFAEAARLEAASVRAFVEMARALDAHGAPRSIVDTCLASARDEVRHARTMTRLARRFGATPRSRARSPKVDRAPSLATLARENAIEGCVRETYGALVLAWQASHASDPSVRASLATIAQDELRHAALSWEVAAWASSRLGVRERRAVARAQRRAAGKLVAEAASDATPSALRDAIGMPDAREAATLARGLFDRLWS